MSLNRYEVTAGDGSFANDAEAFYDASTAGGWVPRRHGSFVGPYPPGG